MEIRESVEPELESIVVLQREAFAEEGTVIAQLVEGLFADPTARPLLSVVAIDNDDIIGSILFTPVIIEDNDEYKRAGSLYIMAPVAVAPSVHGEGVGSAMIHWGLDKLREQGAEIVLVLGDPNYYQRTGFHTRHFLEPPYKLDHPEAWMAKELVAGKLETVRGVVKCSDALNAPEHW